MMTRGDSKYPTWLEAEMAEELAVIGDINICKYMGWTFNELDQQPIYKVMVLTEYMNAENEAVKIIREKAEQERKSRGRGARRGRRRRR